MRKSSSPAEEKSSRRVRKHTWSPNSSADWNSTWPIIVRQQWSGRAFDLFPAIRTADHKYLSCVPQSESRITTTHGSRHFGGSMRNIILGFAATIFTLLVPLSPCAVASDAMPVDQQNTLVRQYCAVCHSDAARNGGLS